MEEAKKGGSIAAKFNLQYVENSKKRKRREIKGESKFWDSEAMGNKVSAKKRKLNAAGGGVDVVKVTESQVRLALLI